MLLFITSPNIFKMVFNPMFLDVHNPICFNLSHDRSEPVVKESVDIDAPTIGVLEGNL
jgi:hypothetical protein